MIRELNFEGSSPILYLIATPIGNLSEVSARTLTILKETDYVAAEDTRHSGELLDKLGIKKPFISCHEHNEEEASEKVVVFLLNGKKVCYMSDAGYPAISDPGYRLVKNCLAKGIKVSCVSGPNAAMNALVASGIDSSRFYFHGFLPSKPSERIRELQELQSKRETMIFYEAPHRIDKTIKDMLGILGDRNACIARELTKAHEEFIRAPLSELAQIDPSTLKGEMVIIVEGKASVFPEISDELITEELRKAIAKGLKGKDAISLVSSSLNVKKNRVYSLYIDMD